MRGMKFAMLIIFSLVTSISSAKRVCSEEEFVKINSKGLPEGSAAILRRIFECNHWGGEVGDTSAGRTKQIEEGVKKANCASLPSDQVTFIKLHAKHQKIETIFSKADAWDGFCD